MHIYIYIYIFIIKNINKKSLVKNNYFFFIANYLNFVYKILGLEITNNIFNKFFLKYFLLKDFYRN